jgi:flagellin-like protein
MSLQVKALKRNKRGISEVIGYVLLTGFVIVLSVGIYAWMKGYVPKDTIGCPDDVSIFVKDYSCSGQTLNLTLKNNGKFNIAGYSIYARNYSQAGVASIDLSQKITSGGTPMDPIGVKMGGNNNSFIPDAEEIHLFNITSITPKIYAIEIVPMRWEEEGRRTRLVTCTESKLEEILNC